MMLINPQCILKQFHSSTNGYPNTSPGGSFPGALGFISMWTYPGNPGAGPIPATTPGTAYNAFSAGSGTGYAHPLMAGNFDAYLGSVLYTFENQAIALTSVQLIDRLVSVSGFNANTTDVQTVNSVALPRYTDGEGVCVALELYSDQASGGANADANVTLNYINQAGDSKSFTTTGVRYYGPSSAIPTGWWTPLYLAPGDTGVRQVLSFQLSSARQSCNLGITLFRPIDRQFNLNSAIPQTNQTFRDGDSPLIRIGRSNSADESPCLSLIFRRTAALGTTDGQYQWVNAWMNILEVPQ